MVSSRPCAEPRQPSTGSGRGRRVAAALVFLLAWPAAPLHAGFLDAAAGAPLVVVGEIEEAGAIDLHGWAAWLVVQRSLRGEAAAGDRLRIGWEELARGRPARFRDADRVVVALGPLPPASLWFERFGADLRRGPVYAVADAGQGYRREPAPESLTRLEAYLAPALADGSPRQRVALADLLQAPDADIAAAAAQRLARSYGHAESVEEDVAAKLAAVIADGERPVAVRAHVARLAGERRWEALRPALEVEAVPESSIEVEAHAALAAIAGSMDAERVAALLRRDEGPLRALAVAYAREPAAIATLPGLLRDDPAAEVRAAAAVAWIHHRGVEAIGDVRPALADATGDVRVATAEALAGLGAAAVEPLEDIFRSGSFAEASGAIVALDRVGEAGRAAIRRLAEDAPDERRRHLAKLALGRLETHSHD